MNKAKRTVILLVCIAMFACAAFPVAAFAAEGEEPVRTEEVGFTLMENWVDGGDGQELKVCDLYFSRDVLMQQNGSSIGYWIIDGADFTYLQQYFMINGRSMQDINENTDTSSYTFSTFPSSLGGVYAVPIIMYSAEPNHIQIRIHKKYLEDSGAEDTFTIAVLEGFYASARTSNEDASAYVPVRYELSGTVTFTKDAADQWTCDTELLPYEPPQEVIDRADIDFSKINYESIHVSDVSDIIVYDAASQAEYMVLYFDRPVSNQYIPYASAGKQMLTNLANAGLGVTLTQEQIDSLYDYRLDLALNDFIKIDGKTIREMKAEEPVNADQRLYLCWSGSSSDPRSITFYFSGGSESWLDPSERHTLEVMEGFTTPLFGKTDETQTFYFDPDTRTWSETDYASLADPVYDWSQQPEGTGLEGWAIGVIAAAAALVAAGGAVLAVVLVKKKKAKQGEKE